MRSGDGIAFSRTPIRRRLVAGFTAVIFVLLVGVGVFVYWRFDVALNRDLDNELIHSGKTLRPLVNDQGKITDREFAAAPGVSWQVLDENGNVLDSDSPATSGEMLLSEKQFAKISEGDVTFNVGALLWPRSDEPYRVRLVATRTTPRYHLLVGARRDQRDNAMRELIGQLLLAGVGILGVSAWTANVLVRSALSPVERYRQRAQQIADGNAELRIEVPADRDDEITRLGHTFNDMLASLDRALAREREFVAEASHELRTPVTLLTSRVQLALRRERTPAEHARILAELQTDLNRLATLAEQLLHREGRYPVEEEPHDLRDEVERVVRARRAVAGTGTLEVDLPPDPVPVTVPVVAVERILTNLIDNARVHGRPPVRVALEMPDPGWAKLSVSDAGDGMDRRLLTMATRRFARSAEARTRPGSGLGLALVRSLVGENGGQLRLCHGGRHVRYGQQYAGRGAEPAAEQHGDLPGLPGDPGTGKTAPGASAVESIACGHDSAMTVTVLLPVHPGVHPMEEDSL